MLNSIIISIFLLCSLESFGQSTTKTNIKNHHRSQHRQKRFSLEFLLTSQLTREIVGRGVDGSYTELGTSLMYHHNENNEFRNYLSTRYMKTKREDFGNKFEVFFNELMYRRKNILSQSKHGFYLEAELKGLKVIDKNIVQNYGYDGIIIPQLRFKRSWGRKFSMEFKIRRHFYQSINEDNYTLNNEDRLYLSGTTFIGPRTMFFTQIKYQHKMRKGEGLDWRFMELAKFPPRSRPDFSAVPIAKKNQEYVTIHPSILHFLTRSSLLEVYFETRLSDTYDKRSVAQISKDQFVIGTALYITAF